MFTSSTEGKGSQPPVPFTGRKAWSARVALAGVVSVSVALVLAGVALGAGRAHWEFGSFAGYVWRGHVTSLQASWSVPGIVGPSAGAAGTWIGAEALGGQFIQVGTNEESFRPFALGARDISYQAFWSDTTHRFRSQQLFRVAVGDNISASLTLAHKRWTLTIADRTSGASARFSTSEEADASFNQAGWDEEDPRDRATGKPIPYPRLTAVRFSHLAVNSAVPDYADMYSQWMSVDGGNLAPAPVRQDSFTLHPATASLVGARYLEIATPEDQATGAFTTEMSRWTAATPPSQIESACSTFSAAVRSDIQALVRARWPTRAQLFVRSLIRTTRVLLDHMQSRPPAFTAGLRAWVAAWGRDGSAVGRAGHLVRRALKLPELTPAA
jgi:Peptidase A4 family